MKKIYYIIISIIALCVCNNVHAEFKAIRAEDTLLAKCQYKYTNTSGEVRKIVVDVTKNSSVGLAYASFFNLVTSGNVQTTYNDFGLMIESFVDENGNTVCANKVYHYTQGEAIGGRGYKTTNYFATSAPKGAHTEYILDESESKIYVSGNYDEEVRDNEGWLNICHYGNKYLKFNKTEYETNISPIVNHTGATAENIDIMKYLSDNNYSCPTSLCSHIFGAQGYYVTRYTLKMEYDKYCITSQNFAAEYRCGSLEMYMRDYEELKETGSIALLNEKMEKIKKFCDSVNKNQDYNDPTYCVKECMKIDEIFKKDIGFDKNGECGFSARLIQWIGNIIRWAKYIVPIAVIVLGILDFMKAISADKEDEMKKAQQRFIRRLIAAALIFIAPFIIEFILNKLGFDANGCGIINL